MPVVAGASLVGVFDTAIRNAVASINSLTLDGGIQVAVSHRAYVTQDALGDGEPYAAAVTRYGVLGEKKHAFHSADGNEIEHQSRLVFVGNVTVTANDQITLPDGTTPPILEVAGPRDSLGGRYLTIVTFGQAAKALRSGAY